MQFTLRQRRSRPAATSGDHSRQRNRQSRASNGARSIAMYTKTAPQPATTADNATARASNGARSIAIYTKTAPQPTSGDQRRPQPTTQPPEPLRERDLLQFTLRQRRSRPAATSGDHSRQRAPPEPLTERDLLRLH